MFPLKASPREFKPPARENVRVFQRLQVGDVVSVTHYSGLQVTGQVHYRVAAKNQKGTCNLVVLSAWRAGGLLMALPYNEAVLSTCNKRTLLQIAQKFPEQPQVFIRAGAQLEQLVERLARVI